VSRLIALLSLALIATLALGGYAIAQDSTPTAGGSATACATPAASPAAGSPTATIDPNAPQNAVPGTPEATPCASPAAGGNVIDMVDIAFQPTQITIAANTDVVLQLTNKGALTHNFTIDELNISSGDVTGGGSVSVTINAKPGTYQFYCSVPGHKDLGMIGTLIVQ
jgi:nitrite reductase (NO-forming)